MNNNVSLKQENFPQFPWPHVSDFGYENYYGQVYLKEHKICFWWRYTFLKGQSGTVIPRVWGAIFYHDHPQDNLFLSHPVPENLITVNTEGIIFDGVGHYRYGSTAGNINDILQWDFQFAEDQTTFFSVGNRLLAELLSRSKNVSPNNNIFASGSLSVNGTTYSFKKQPAHQGHTWGKVMAPGWVWCHCNAFDDEDTVFELVGLDKKQRAPIGSYYFKWKGQEYLFNELRHFIGRQFFVFPYYRNQLSWDTKKLTFSGQERELRIEGTVIADPAQYHLVRYTNTDDTFLYNLNDSVAKIYLNLSIQKSSGWEKIAELESTGAQIEFVSQAIPPPAACTEAETMGRKWNP
ncbi:tocopherol cyclase family protein [candidate division CSSED10-310 bacterium]|uniref:Tocopherol cyclase family protein n=1 Tax=candidate division CSSED10-310 bacterium TaxID=2855610 RepID=A0ABV6YRD6_UNCC1